MKIAVIFRGEHIRRAQLRKGTNRKYVDILQCWDNIKQQVVEDLKQECDIIFITYDSNLIDKVKETIKPKEVIIIKKKHQYTNFLEVLDFMKKHQTEYDRFVILRCDFRYKLPITQWPNWSEKGIFIVNKDVHWPTKHFYSDIIFVVDREYIDAFETATKSNKNKANASSLHHIGAHLHLNKLPFILMYDDYYHMTNHPLHSLASIEAETHLDLPGTKVVNLEKWNPRTLQRKSTIPQ